MHFLNLRLPSQRGIPMLDNFHLSLISGGFYHCTPQWSRASSEIDRCYKCYLPTCGEASVWTDSGPSRITPGHIYLIPGHRLRRQQCDATMDVHWVHFTPESYHLNRILSRVASVHRWSLDQVPWVAEPFQRVAELFEDPNNDDSHLRVDPPLGLSCRIEAVLMFLVAEILDRVGDDAAEDASHAELMRLKPAIDFMDANYSSNPLLAEVAARAGLSPNYFHRIFRREAGITPFQYMEGRRLDASRRLLAEGRLSIKEIAARSGYDNPFYFSRAFRKRFAFSPSNMRGQHKAHGA